MQTPPAKFGIVASPPVGPVPSDPRNHASISGSFAQELQAVWGGDAQIVANPAPSASNSAESGKGTADQADTHGATNASSAPTLYRLEVHTENGRNTALPTAGETSVVGQNSRLIASQEAGAGLLAASGAASQKNESKSGDISQARVATGSDAGSYSNTPAPNAPPQNIYRQFTDACPEIFQLKNSIGMASWPAVNDVEGRDPASIVPPPASPNQLASNHSSPPVQHNLAATPETYPAAHSILNARIRSSSVQRLFLQDPQESGLGGYASLAAPAVIANPSGENEQQLQASAQGVSTPVASGLADFPSELTLTEPDQTAMAQGWLRAPGVVTPGDPKSNKSLEPGVSGSPASAAQIPQAESSSKSQDVSEKQTDVPQLAAGPADCGLSTTDAGLAADSGLSRFSAPELQAFGAGNSDLNCGRTDADGPTSQRTPPRPLFTGTPDIVGAVFTPSNKSQGQEQPGNSRTPVEAMAEDQDYYGQVVLTPGGIPQHNAGFEREAAAPEAGSSRSAPSGSPPTDKSESPDPTGSHLDKKGSPSESGNVALAPLAWTQTSGNSSSASDESSQDPQPGYSAARSGVAPKSAPIPNSAEKAGPASRNSDLEVAAGLTPVIRRDSQAQGEPAPASTDSARRAPSALPNWDEALDRLPQYVNFAHLAGGEDQSEMLVNMKSDSWGTISVHATLTNGQVGAEIQVSDREAHAALTEGLNSLEKRLGENGIQVANLDVSQGLGGSYSHSQNQQEKSAGQPTSEARALMYRSVVNTGALGESPAVNTIDDFVLGRVSVRV